MSYEHVWVLLALAWIFGWAGLVILAGYLKKRSRLKLREMIHKERMLAMEKGVPLSELPDHLAVEAADDDVGLGPAGDWGRKAALALGLVFLFGGIGLAAGFWLMPAGKETEEIRSAASLGLIPFMLGVGLLLYYRLSRPAD